MSRGSSKSWWVAVALGSWLVGCEEPLSCTLMACGGVDVALALVDETGTAVAAKGEYRSSDGRTSATPFECTLAPGAPSLFPVCDRNVVRLDGANLQPGVSYEVHFENDNGEWSDWLPVPLQLTKRTDPDFNGPGCECTWYNGQTPPLVVPSAARRTAP